MNSLGKVIEWNDQKGYGFIAPLEGDGKLFFHVRDYQQQGRRPEAGDLVRFRAGKGDDGRPRASQVSRAVAPPRAAAKKATTSARELPMIAVAVAILAYVAVIAWAIHGDRLPMFAGLALCAVNAATYIAYALDKHAAQRDRQRIAENSLHLLELLGGWPAALLAQKSLRHKTRKQSYRVVFWLAVIANCAVLGWWLWGR